MPQNTGLDIRRRQVPLQEDVVAQKDHGYRNVVCSFPELLQGLGVFGRECILEIELYSKLQQGAREK